MTLFWRRKEKWKTHNWKQMDDDHSMGDDNIHYANHILLFLSSVHCLQAERIREKRMDKRVNIWMGERNHTIMGSKFHLQYGFICQYNVHQWE